MKLVILFFIVLTTVSFLPYKSKYLNKTQLQERYVSALKEYEGSRYAPYGESGGISCSTLIRQALIDAVGDDPIMYSAIESHPCPSEELNKGCSGELSQVLHAENLKSIDYKKIKKGDIAILGNFSGIHTLAYIGKKTWIHADPITEEVVEVRESMENDDWNTYQVNVMRWNLLKDN